MAKKKAEGQSSHDQLFKGLLRAFLDELVQLLAPSIAKKLDLRAPEFLDKETFTDLPRGKHRYLDVVAKVPSLEKEEELVLIHVEIEGVAREEMAERMWRYYMQLQLRHALPCLPAVLFLSGGEPDIRWNTRQSLLFEQEISRFSFLSFGLSQTSAEDYLARPQALCAALAAKMKPSTLSRPQLKVECLKKIARAKVDEARQFLLVNFVQTYLSLDGKEAQDYDTLLKSASGKEAKTMQLTWADQIREQGKTEGRAQAILELLEGRGVAVSQEQREKILACVELDTLRQWLLRAASAKTVEEVFSPTPKKTSRRTSKKSS